MSKQATEHNTSQAQSGFYESKETRKNTTHEITNKSTIDDIILMFPSLKFTKIVNNCKGSSIKEVLIHDDLFTRFAVNFNEDIRLFDLKNFYFLLNISIYEKSIDETALGQIIKTLQS